MVHTKDVKCEDCGEIIECCVADTPLTQADLKDMGKISGKCNNCGKIIEGMSKDYPNIDMINWITNDFRKNNKEKANTKIIKQQLSLHHDYSIGHYEGDDRSLAMGCESRLLDLGHILNMTFEKSKFKDFNMTIRVEDNGKEINITIIKK